MLFRSPANLVVSAESLPRNHECCSATNEPGQYPGGVVVLPLCAGNLSQSFTLYSCGNCTYFKCAQGTYLIVLKALILTMGIISWADEGSQIILFAREVSPGLYEDFQIFPDIISSHEV